MSSHKAFLAKSTSNCSRSMVETVLMASTNTPSNIFITVKEPKRMNSKDNRPRTKLSFAIASKKSACKHGNKPKEYPQQQKRFEQTAKKCYLQFFWTEIESQIKSCSERQPGTSEGESLCRTLSRTGGRKTCNPIQRPDHKPYGFDQELG